MKNKTSRRREKIRLLTFISVTFNQERIWVFEEKIRPTDTNLEYRSFYKLQFYNVETDNLGKEEWFSEIQWQGYMGKKKVKTIDLYEKHKN